MQATFGRCQGGVQGVLCVSNGSGKNEKWRGVSPWRKADAGDREARWSWGFQLVSEAGGARGGLWAEAAGRLRQM